MMTREEIKEIVDYSQEHGITIKRRLQELNVSESNYYYAKRMYAREDMVPGVEGCFLQIAGNPSPVAAMPGNIYRKGRGKDAPPESPMTVELRIGPDTAMRVQGAMTPEHLQAIMYGVVSRV
jgi:hypothetical protein